MSNGYFHGNKINESGQQKVAKFSRQSAKYLFSRFKISEHNVYKMYRQVTMMSTSMFCYSLQNIFIV